MKKDKIIFVAGGQVAFESSKVYWPDLNYPGTGATILRFLYKVDYDKKTIQLDGPEGPTFENNQLPEGAGFYIKHK